MFKKRQQNKQLHLTFVKALLNLSVLTFLSTRRILVLYFQPITFVRFDNESVSRGLPALEEARGLDPWRSPKGSCMGSGDENEQRVE